MAARLDDDWDGIQYDTMHAPDPAQIEAAELRAEAAAGSTVNNFTSTSLWLCSEQATGDRHGC